MRVPDRLAMRRSRAARRRRAVHLIRATLTVVLAIAVAGCSPSGSTPHANVDEAIEPEPTRTINSLTVRERGVWGPGRAQWAQNTTRGLAVVTTTGVYLQPMGDRTLQTIDRLSGMDQLAAAAISPDEETLVVALAPEPAIRVYDLVSARLLRSFALPPDAAVRMLHVLPDAGGLIADTVLGPFAVTNTDSAPRPILDSTTSALTSRLADGTLVSPMSNSSDVVLSRADQTERRTLELPDGATVIDSRSTINGDAVAISIGVGDGLDRRDRLVVVDPSTFNTTPIVDADRPLDANEWALAEHGLAISDGAALQVWSLSGDLVGGGTLLPTAIVNLVPFRGGVLAVHADGGIVRWSEAGWTATVMSPGGVALDNVQISDDGATVTTVDQLGTISTWDLPGGTRTDETNSFAMGQTTDVAISIDDLQVGVASTSGRVSVLDETLEDTWSFYPTAEPESVGAVSFDPRSGALATGLGERLSESAYDDAVTLWDAHEQQSRFTVGGEREDVPGCSLFVPRLRFSPDGAQLAMTSHDFSVVVVDAATGALIRQIPGSTTVLDMAFSPDSDLLVASYEDGLVNVWSTVDYEVVGSYRSAQGGFHSIAVMPDSATMVASDVTGTIGVFDLVTGTPIRVVANTTQRTSTIALSRDGVLLAAPLSNYAIGIWSVENGTQLATLAGHAAEVTGVAFANSGAWLASSSRDGTIRTWSIATE